MFLLIDTILDAGCPLKIFNKHDFNKIPYFQGVHRFYSFFFQKIGLDVLQIKINWRKRKFGHTKFNNMCRFFCSIYNILIIYFFYRKFL